MFVSHLNQLEQSGGACLSSRVIGVVEIVSGRTRQDDRGLCLLMYQIGRFVGFQLF